MHTLTAAFVTSHHYTCTAVAGASKASKRVSIKISCT